MCTLATAFLKFKVEDMYDTKKLQESISAWNNPVQCVPKNEEIIAFYEKFGLQAHDALWNPKNKALVMGLYRLTGDYRALNASSIYEVFPLPLISTLLNKMKGSSRYTTSDIMNAFWTVELAEASRELTAFSTPNGHHEYMCLPQGTKSAANTFARIVYHAFKQLEARNMFPYQDDLQNHESDFIKHLLLWQDIVDITIDKRMVLKPSKTHFNHDKMKILGHVMSSAGREADPSLIRAITDLAVPTDITGVRSVLGLLQVAREYVNGLAAHIAPLQALTKKGVNIKASWNSECQACFDNIKRILTTLPVLMIPDPGRPFYIHVDACRVGRGLGAVLLQRGPVGSLQPVAYWSRSLSDAERKFSATELECTAVHDVILHFRTFLQNGLSFEVIVDHYALVYMILKPNGDPHQRLDRLCMDLQEFSFSIKHRRGKVHIDADIISRLLRTNDQPYVNTTDSLRTDNFLSEEDRNDLIKNQYPPQDAAVIIAIMDEHAGRDSHHIDDSLGPRTTATTFVPPTPPDEILQQIASWKFKYPQIIKDHSHTDALMIIAIMEEQEASATTTTAEEAVMRTAQLNTICCQTPITSADIISMHTSIIEQVDIQSPLQQLISQSWSLQPGTNDSDNTLQRVERFLRNPVLFIAYCEAIVTQTVGHASHSLRHTLQLDSIVRGTAYLLCQMHNKSTQFNGNWQVTIIDKLNNIGVMKRFILSLRQVTRLSRFPLHYEQAVLTGLGDQLWLSLAFQRANNTLTSHNADELFVIFPQLSWRTTADEPSIKNKNTESLTPTTQLRFNSTMNSHISLTALKDITRMYTMANASTQVLALATEIDRSLILANQNFLSQLHLEQARRKQRQFGPDYQPVSLKTVLETQSFIRMNLSHVKDAVRIHAGSKANAGTTVTRTYELRIRPEKTQTATPITASNFLAEERQQKQARKAVMKQRQKAQPTAREIVALENATTDERVEAIIEDDNHILADFDWLVMLNFKYNARLSPEDDSMHLCQVINVFRDKKRDQFMATACVIMDGATDKYPLQLQFILPVMDYKGKKGTISLVHEYGAPSNSDKDLVWPTTTDEWITAQQNDQHWSKVLDTITSDKTTVNIGGIANNGELCRRVEPATKTLGPLLRRTVSTETHIQGQSKLTVESVKLQLIIPEALVKSCLHFHHELMGHPGRNRTTRTIALRYWWPSARRDIIKHTKGCRGCQTRKAFNGRAKVPVQTYDVMSGPMQRVHTDLTGPFPETARGNKYVLVIKDALTKMVEFIPIPDKTALAVVTAAVLFFRILGFPRVWVTDRGTEADNIQWMKSLENLLDLHHIKTTPANPRSDGQVESSMGPFKDALTQLTNKFQDDWDLMCSELGAFYRGTVCEQTGHTPNFLMFGRELPSPSEEHISTPLTGKVSEYVKNLQETLQFCWEKAGEQVVNNVSKYNAVPKERLIFKPYEVGQWFFIRRIPKRFFKSKGDKKAHHLVAKLQMRYCGPYRITKVINPVLYEADIHNTIKRVHAVNMKPA